MLLGILASQKKPQPDSPPDPLDTSTSNVIQHTDDTAAGSTSAFLDSKLVYTVDEHGQSICKVKVKAQVPKLIIGEDGSVTAGGEEEKEEEIGVMMGWETGIMKEAVRKLTEGHPNEKEGLKVLNIGFGLGIVRFHFLIHRPRLLMRYHWWIDRHAFRVPHHPTVSARYHRTSS